MIIHDVEQNTDEWMKIRGGKFTASTFADLFAKPSTSTYKNAINKVVFERITGELPESFSNKWMERGKELEPQAIETYELSTFNKVHRVGFIERSEWVGCSPDGLIGTDGMIQVKCPASSTLIEYMMSQKVPDDYMIQMQGEIWVAERKWSKFYVYHPKLKPLIIHVERDEKIIAEIEKQVELAIEQAKDKMHKLNARNK